MKYCGGTFSGPKTTLCAEEITVVGHRCTFEGRLPETDRVGVINRWPACKNVSEVRMFLGTIGVCRVFIKDFARLAGPLNNLLSAKVNFEWTKEHDTVMQELKDALRPAQVLEAVLAQVAERSPRGQVVTNQFRSSEREQHLPP